MFDEKFLQQHRHQCRGKSIDKAVGHLDAQLQPTKLFVRNVEFHHYEVVCQERWVRVKVNKPEWLAFAMEDSCGLEHIGMP